MPTLVAIPVEVRQGKLRLLDRTLYEKVVESLREGRLYHLTIFDPRAERKTVSDPMRRYYFGVVATMIAEQTGHSKDMIHEALKRKFLAYEDEETGLEMVPSVFSEDSTMTVEDKKAFIEEVRRWAWDFLQLAIPEPEKVVIR